MRRAYLAAEGAVLVLAVAVVIIVRCVGVRYRGGRRHA